MDPVPHPLLQAKDLTVEVAEWPKERRIGLRQFSLSLAPAEILVLAGEMGCGASLFARFAAGIGVPRSKVLSGSLDFEGRSLLRRTRRQGLKLRRGPITVLASERLAPPEPDRTVGQWLRDLRGLRRGAWRDWEDPCFSVGLLEPERLLPRRLAELRPLERKRLALLRAILLESRLLVIEEAEADLDPLEREVWQALLPRFRDEHGVALLIVSRSLQDVERYADRVVMLFEGGVLEEGSPEALIASPRFTYTREFRTCAPRLFASPLEWPIIPPAAIREAEAAVHGLPIQWDARPFWKGR